MYITAVTPFLVDPGTGKNWLFVKVDTSESISGWGECYTQADRDQSIVAHVRQLGRYLAEFDFRHNSRAALGVDDLDRATRALIGAKGKRLTYRTTRGQQAQA